jgi:hypothetical protein
MRGVHAAGVGRREQVADENAEDLRQAALEPGIDGFLIDYAAKGARVDAAGTDNVEGHPAYKLKVTRKDGTVRNVWVDGGSFLDLKVDGEPRKLDGKPHSVAVYLRDYKRDQGLMIPHLQETVVLDDDSEMMIELVGVGRGQECEGGGQCEQLGHNDSRSAKSRQVGY